MPSSRPSRRSPVVPQAAGHPRPPEDLGFLERIARRLEDTGDRPVRAGRNAAAGGGTVPCGLPQQAAAM